MVSAVSSQETRTNTQPHPECGGCHALFQGGHLMKSIFTRLGHVLGLSMIIGIVVGLMSFVFIAPAQADDSNTRSSVSKTNDKVERRIAKMAREVKQKAGTGAVCTPTTETVEGVQY